MDDGQHDVPPGNEAQNVRMNNPEHLGNNVGADEDMGDAPAAAARANDVMVIDDHNFIGANDDIDDDPDIVEENDTEDDDDDDGLADQIEQHILFHDLVDADRPHPAPLARDNNPGPVLSLGNGQGRLLLRHASQNSLDESSQRNLPRNDGSHSNPPFTNGQHFQRAFDVFNVMRSGKTLCDVVLIAGDVEVSAHKTVLAACSPYFMAMFTSKY
ncbi:hypothetical protein HAZT_HAZT006686 [Hyalella azteca]|uniref:BTB domain-containing protein n=1 Tax=Hyalella azteca TaxID=294128 RepID=A0A6A0GW53_HYAAZ|nr:hypothetical protein HAZT_HAZT006686 [Hyalella azteca]